MSDLLRHRVLEMKACADAFNGRGAYLARAAE
jgi:hypothetical protein